MPTLEQKKLYWNDRGMFGKAQVVCVNKSSWRRCDKLNGLRGNDRIMVRTHYNTKTGYETNVWQQKVLVPNFMIGVADAFAVDIFEEDSPSVENVAKFTTSIRIVTEHKSSYVGIYMPHPRIGWLGRDNYTKEEFMNWKKNEVLMKDMTPEEKSLMSRIQKRQRGVCLDLWDGKCTRYCDI